MAEFAIALGLLTKRRRRPACVSAVLLLGTFTVVYLAVNPAGVCGCWFTLTLNSGGYFHILQNLVFIALAILTWMDHRSTNSTLHRSCTLPALQPRNPTTEDLNLHDNESHLLGKEETNYDPISGLICVHLVCAADGTGSRTSLRLASNCIVNRAANFKQKGSLIRHLKCDSFWLTPLEKVQRR
jgi:putative Ca2+/H+ antiporter (TMEM165/GDT1 family)